MYTELVHKSERVIGEPCCLITHTVTSTNSSLHFSLSLFISPFSTFHLHLTKIGPKRGEANGHKISSPSRQESCAEKVSTENTKHNLTEIVVYTG